MNLDRVTKVVGALLLCVAAQSHAAKYEWEEFETRIASSSEVESLDDNGLGEQIALSNGSLAFAETDVAIPGNDSLSVALKRSYAVSNRKEYATDSMFADWDIDLPNVSGVFLPNWESSSGVSGKRCLVDLGSAMPPTYPGAQAYQYWHGNHINLPDVDSSEMLLLNTDSPKPSSGGPYYWITEGRTYLSCLSSIKNGAGEGFVAITSDGTRYWFDWMAQYVEPTYKVYNSYQYTRRKNVLYATRVEDRFGNWVNYTYSNAWNAPGKLTAIDASDGRSLSLSYNSYGHISTVNAGARQWTYGYVDIGSGRRSLTQVGRPDGSSWSIGFSEFTKLAITYPNVSPLPTEQERDCFSNPVPVSPTGSIVGTITHPAGAVGQFAVALRSHRRSNVPVFCLNYFSGENDPGDDVNRWPFDYESFTLLSKRVTGPGLPQMDWSYGYTSSQAPRQLFYPGATMTNPCPAGTNCGAPICVTDTCAGKTFTEIIGPTGQWSRYSFGNSYRYNEAKLLQVERGSSGQNILATVSNSYDFTVSGQSYPARYGQSPRGFDDGFVPEYHRPLTQTTTAQQGSNFTSTANSFDVFARPLSVTKSSTTSGNPTKTEVTEYYDDPALWVMGQVAKVTCVAPAACTPASSPSGIVISQTDYGWRALPWKTYSFGRLQQTLSYDSISPVTSGQLGTHKTVTDGNNNVTTLSSWKRGIPQTIQYPATPESSGGAIQSAVVNDDGWIRSVTDENGFATNYDYDAMGRMSSIVYPTGDSTVWNTVSMAFQKINADEHGLPAGHWRASRYEGNKHINTYYDAMWRPVLEEQLDYADIAGTLSQTVKRYDTNGRLSFQSYPQRGIGNYWDITQGIRTSYDALDRVIQVEQDSELGVLASTTEYQTGFKTLTTNPRQQATTATYIAYDVPTFDLPVTVQEPEGRGTTIVRDVFGKPIALTRGGNGAIATRRYVYQADQLLCKVVEPETGATVYGYDYAGNLTKSAAGLQGYGDLNSCNQPEAWASGRAVDRTYDARNRLNSLTFPDGKGNQAWVYTPDGQPASITTNNFSAGGSVVNSYAYNKRRMLVGESISQPGWYSWSLGYVYDTNGSLGTQTYPTGMVVSYAPNALGQATQAGSYASGVQYHPNGAIKQFTYGNGIVHTMQQNTRQLPQRSTDSGGALDLAYSFDANANVNHIWDYAQDSGNGFYGRWMTYDGLDRLTDAGSCSFGGDCWHRFTYDALDNLKSWKLPGIKDYAEYVYDAKNQLTNIKDSTGATVVGLGYDAQGNLANNNGFVYQFDYGNRLRSNSSEQSFTYDGYGRRASVTRGFMNPRFRKFAYAANGQLLYEENTANNSLSEHVYLGGSLIATRSSISTIPNGQPTVTYAYTDALGSPVAKTNQAGVVQDRTSYEPYGTAINKPTYEGIGYTGHVMDSATGLTYMQQRYYDPAIGRFLSVDPVAANASTGANFNSYWYANNNPYKFTDPDGRQSCDESCQIERDIRRDFGYIRVQGAVDQGQKVLGQAVEVADKEATNPWNWVPFGLGAKTAGRGALAGAERSGVGFELKGALKSLKGMLGFRESSAVAKQIAGGHALGKHANQFASMGIKTEKQFATFIDRVMSKPDATRELRNGRTAYWDNASGTVVIHNPNAADGGTAFKPDLGRQYFDEVLR